MRFRLFAVEAIGNVEVVLVSQRNSGGRCQRDSFIGRSKQDIELYSGIDDGLGIKSPQTCQVPTGIEQARIKEIRAYAARLEGELAETQYTCFDRKLQKVFLVLLHNISPEA